MKDIYFLLLIFVMTIFLWILVLVIHDSVKSSSPVEEMIHRQIVTTVDSILNARDCIEPDDITIPHDISGRIIMEIKQ